MIDRLPRFGQFRRFARPLRPVALPVWFLLQRSSAWQAYQERARVRRPARPYHAFCIGLPKTGTQSLAQMLRLRAAHEPETNTLLHLYARQLKGKMSVSDQAAVLRARDTLLWLEMESNFMLGLVIEAMNLAFPEARYVLTVRDPRSWLESQINEEAFTVVPNRVEPFWTAFNYMYGTQPPGARDSAFSEWGLHSLEGYLTYWATHNMRVLETIPEDRLLVVLTKDISAKADEINTFVGAPGVWTQKTNSHARPVKRLTLNKMVDADYLTTLVEKHTAEAQLALEQRIGTEILSARSG